MKQTNGPTTATEKDILIRAIKSKDEQALLSALSFLVSKYFNEPVVSLLQEAIDETHTAVVHDLLRKDRAILNKWIAKDGPNQTLKAYFKSIGGA